MIVEHNQEKRTMIAFLMQGVLFFFGYCFFDANTVLPVFVEAATGKVELAGVAGSIRQFSTLFFQLLLGSLVVKIKNVPRYIACFLLLGYSMPLCVSLFLLSGCQGMALVYATFAAVGVMWMSDGMMVIGYYDLFGRTVSPENRGRILGLQQLLGGAGALLGAFIVKRILDMQSLEFSQKYALLFFIGSVILLAAGAFMFLAKDISTRKPEKTYNLGEQLRKLFPLVRSSKSLRIVLFCQVFFTFATMISPYCLVMCSDFFAVKDETVSLLLNFQVVGTLAGGGVSAFLAPRRGNRMVLLVYCVSCFICPLCGLMAMLAGERIVQSMLIVIMVVACGVTTASWAGFMNMIIDISRGKNTHSYMLVNSVITLPLSVSGVAAGQLIKYFGYDTLLVICLCCALIALLLIKNLGKNITSRA